MNNNNKARFRTSNIIIIIFVLIWFFVFIVDPIWNDALCEMSNSQFRKKINLNRIIELLHIIILSKCT